MKLSLIALLGASAIVSAAPAAEPEPLFSRQAAKSINDAMIRKGKKYFGTATDANLLNVQSNSNIIKANFGQVTPENRCVPSAYIPPTPRFNRISFKMSSLNFIWLEKYADPVM